jgi:methionyl-tRNA synthetase
MVQRYRNGTVPRDASGYATPLETDARRSLETYARAMDALALEDGAAELVTLAARANRYVEASAPWTLAKSGDPAALDTVLANLTRSVARISVLASPFMPEKSEQLWNTLGSGRRLAEVRFSDVIDLDPAGWAVEKLSPLFPKP